MPPVELPDEEKDLVEKINARYRLADEGAHKEFRSKANHYYSLYRNVSAWSSRVGLLDRPDRDRAFREARDRWGEELFIPYSFRTVETVIPRMLAHRPKIVLTPKDEQALGNVDSMRMLIEYQQKQFRYELLLQDIAKDGLIYGLGVQKTGWRKEYTKVIRTNTGVTGKLVEEAEEICSIDDGWIWRVDPLDFLWDHAAAEIDEAEYLFHRTWRSPGYIKRMVEAGPEHGGWRQDIELDDLLSNGPSNKREEIYGERFEAEGLNTAKPQGEHLHEVWEYHDRYTGKVTTVLDGWCPVRHIDNPAAHGGFPFQVYRPTKVPGRMVGIGEIEPIEKLQYEINDLRTMRRDSDRMSLMQVYAFDDSTVDAEDLKGGIFPGAAIPVNGAPRDFLFPLPFKGPQNSSYQEEQSTRQDLDTTSGISDMVTGADSGGHETATGVQLVQAAASARIQNKGRRAEVELCVPAGEQLIFENQRRITSKRALPIEEPSDGIDPPKWTLFELGPNETRGLFAFDVEGGSTAAENVPQMRQDAQTWVQLAGTGQFDEQWVARKVAELMGVTHPESVVKPPTPQVPVEAVAAFVEQALGMDPNQVMPALQQFVQQGGQPPQDAPEQQAA